MSNRDWWPNQPDLRRWLNGAGGRLVIAIDGKTVRGAKDKNGKAAAEIRSPANLASQPNAGGGDEPDM